MVYVLFSSAICLPPSFFRRPLIQWKCHCRAATPLKGGVILKKYIVDMRSLSESERNRIYQLLSDWSFMPPELSSVPGVYIVFWDLKETIESVTGLLSSAVTPQE